MKSIFYDLETTDLAPIGQILNYAFITVDENWNEVSRLVGKVKISRLELPKPGAILANRTDVIEHQEDEESIPEHKAMLKIRNYIEREIMYGGSDVAMVGYNSMRFDMPYLRTSMMRNGISPYFGKSVINRDMLHVVQKLLVTDDDFLEMIEDDEESINFRLENVTTKLGLLEGVQQHESEADVLLTIKLAKFLSENYDLDVRGYDSYEPVPYFERPGMVVKKVFPEKGRWREAREYRDTGTAVMTCLDSNKNYALWIDMKKWEEGGEEDAVFWYNKRGSCFYIQEVFENEELSQKAHQAREELSHITLDTYFEDNKNCDIEQFIYMLTFEAMEGLNVAIWRNDTHMLKELKNPHASTLYLRSTLKYCSELSDYQKELLKDYAMYRYGGKLKLSKRNQESVYQEGVYCEDFHMTWNDCINEIEEYKKDANEDDLHLLNQLEKFYYDSDIAQYCLDDLKEIHRYKKEDNDD